MTLPRTHHSESVALLIDEHLLDSYLAAHALRPRQLFLLHAPAMRSPRERLTDVVAPSLPKTRLKAVTIRDDTSADAVRAALHELPKNVHLHHTGGTGAMAALARSLHGALCSPGALASCLDEERRLIRFDSGEHFRLEDLVSEKAVDLRTISGLYGLTLEPQGGRPHLELRLADALAIAAMKLGVAAKSDKQTANHVERAHAPGGRPSKRWKRYWDGGWLEQLVAMSVRATAPKHEIAVGARISRPGGYRPFELDVVAVGHYRPCVISCKAGESGITAKHALFEVDVRAEQLGGRVARRGLAALVHPGSRPPPAVLRAEFADLWTSPTEPALFDRDALRGWRAALARTNGRTATTADVSRDIPELLNLAVWLHG